MVNSQKAPTKNPDKMDVQAFNGYWTPIFNFRRNLPECGNVI
jgi:hypothetical protein